MITVLVLVLIALVVAMAVFAFDGGPVRAVRRRTIIERPVRRVVERPVAVERTVPAEETVTERVIRD